MKRDTANNLSMHQEPKPIALREAVSRAPRIEATF